MQHSKMKAIIQDFMDILGGSIYEASEEIGFSDRYLWRVYHNKDLISPAAQNKIVDRIEKYSFGCCIEGGELDYMPQSYVYDYSEDPIFAV